jgi:hypothetical protein
MGGKCSRHGKEEKFRVFAGKPKRKRPLEK